MVSILSVSNVSAIQVKSSDTIGSVNADIVRPVTDSTRQKGPLIDVIQKLVNKKISADKRELPQKGKFFGYSIYICRIYAFNRLLLSP